eukprot:CAMPEP_0183326948 /NCGR_PEP_ID=MMETSP0160_2-20130417/83503_1 /TAXON_ID=2839 ORGANISM="Odontella Sinensis, Strain Grunow 1884" /NCGR_SAMPLE_ID=MMETSP0160_2 /ASSEMBLY_ACC=CAM_ASM_000250 /LENGTH=70 /DNA_ID=CAMNT_0025495049 /DNA_START=76 /DNA_END=284 /DNA_ORIENTATION=+
MEEGEIASASFDIPVTFQNEGNGGDGLGNSNASSSTLELLDEADRDADSGRRDVRSVQSAASRARNIMAG